MTFSFTQLIGLSQALAPAPPSATLRPHYHHHHHHHHHHHSKSWPLAASTPPLLFLHHLTPALRLPWVQRTTTPTPPPMGWTRWLVDIGSGRYIHSIKNCMEWNQLFELEKWCPINQLQCQTCVCSLCLCVCVLSFKFFSLQHRGHLIHFTPVMDQCVGTSLLDTYTSV